MKIAFVGKGGAGKTTVSTLFSQFYSNSVECLAIDADINMHMAQLLGLSINDTELLSEKQPSEAIRTHLRGDNSRIVSNAVFKKSTPPGDGSRLITVSDPGDWFMKTYTHQISEGLRAAVVGSYSEGGLASSCYHNNLAILENILSHTRDDGAVIVDMVAGTDAFASTLYAQFDALVIVVEPTRRSLSVFEDYMRLADAGGVADRVLVVANKIDDEDDEAFVRDVVGDRYIGSIGRSRHLALVDKGREAMNVAKMDEADIKVFRCIAKKAEDLSIPAQQRLEKLWDIHRVYVGQDYIKNRSGDLTVQIDPLFQYEA